VLSQHFCIADKLANTTNFTFHGIEFEALLLLVDEEGRGLHGESERLIWFSSRIVSATKCNSHRSDSSTFLNILNAGDGSRDSHDAFSSTAGEAISV
jgi:hypothetical protein